MHQRTLSSHLACAFHIFSVMKRKQFAEVPDLPHTGKGGAGTDGAVLGFFKLSNIVLLCYCASVFCREKDSFQLVAKGKRKDIKLSRFYQVSSAKDLVASCQC